MDLPHGAGVEYQHDGVTVNKQGNFENGKFVGSKEVSQEEGDDGDGIFRSNNSNTNTPTNATTTISTTLTLTSSSPIMSAPLNGIFPRYDVVPIKMLQGAQFADLDDDEIPTPTNLAPGKTRADWLAWVRQNYPTA